MARPRGGNQRRLYAGMARDLAATVVLAEGLRTMPESVAEPAPAPPATDESEVAALRKRNDRLVHQWLDGQEQLSQATNIISLLADLVLDYLEEHGLCHADDTGGCEGHDACPCGLCQRARGTIPGYLKPNLGKATRGG